MSMPQATRLSACLCPSGCALQGARVRKAGSQDLRRQGECPEGQEVTSLIHASPLGDPLAREPEDRGELIEVLVVVKDREAALCGRGGYQRVRDSYAVCAGAAACGELSHGGDRGVRHGAGDRGSSQPGQGRRGGASDVPFCLSASRHGVTRVHAAARGLRR